jgi:deoxyribodipyrimidine photo-lyase
MHGLVWFRRDLRTVDHAALSRALQSCDRVWCVFIFDTDILDCLPHRQDRRVEFIREALQALHDGLARLAPGAGLIVLQGRPCRLIPWLAARLGVQVVHANRDYEPQALERDAEVSRQLAAQGCQLATWQDQVIFSPDALRTGTGNPYSVFTPYKNAWRKQLDRQWLTAYPVAPHGGVLAALPKEPLLAPNADRPAELRGGPWLGPPSLSAIQFEATNLRALGVVPNEDGAQALFADFLARIGDYRHARDFPAIKGPSYLSVHLRFGTISVRQLVRTAIEIESSEPAAADGASVWLSELIWREFYFQVLANWPRVAQSAFRPEYDAIRFDEDAAAQERFLAWTEGRTGYPLIDAAIAQIRHSGWMHNRLRMVTASFLVKDLGIHWRAGEQWFAHWLLDFDLAANNGGWQWAASSGCDAQPYFRIFNPITQSEKFDPQGRFIRRYLPQLAELPTRSIHAPWLASGQELLAAKIVLGQTYPKPIVDHASARQATLARYAIVKSRP